MRADFDGAAGVFVAGGWTPGYHEALVEPGTDWLPGAPVRRLLGRRGGGERRRRSSAGTGSATVAICAEEAGEDLEQLTVRPGLGLVPFAVDVHATQWGTLTRLVHAVRAGAVSDGLAVDEGTVAIVRDGELAGVEGLGVAYRVDARRCSWSSCAGGERARRPPPRATGYCARLKCSRPSSVGKTSAPLLRRSELSAAIANA